MWLFLVVSVGLLMIGVVAMFCLRPWRGIPWVRGLLRALWIAIGVLIAALLLLTLLNLYAYNSILEFLAALPIPTPVGKLLAVAVTATALYGAFYLLSWRAHKRWRGVLILGGLAVLLCAVYLLWGIQSGYVVTLDGRARRCSNPGGLDPETELSCERMTAAMLLLFRESGPAVPLVIEQNPTDPVFFDIKTGKPLRWLCDRKDGNYWFARAPIHDPETGRPCKPVTRQIAEEYRRKLAADEALVLENREKEQHLAEVRRQEEEGRKAEAKRRAQEEAARQAEEERRREKEAEAEQRRAEAEQRAAELRRLEQERTREAEAARIKAEAQQQAEAERRAQEEVARQAEEERRREKEGEQRRKAEKEPRTYASTRPEVVRDGQASSTITVAENIEIHHLGLRYYFQIPSQARVLESITLSHGTDSVVVYTCRKENRIYGHCGERQGETFVTSFDGYGAAGKWNLLVKAEEGWIQSWSLFITPVVNSDGTVVRPASQEKGAPSSPVMDEEAVSTP